MFDAQSNRFGRINGGRRIRAYRLKLAILGHLGESSGGNRQLSARSAVASRPIEEAKPGKVVDSSQMIAASITSVPQLQSVRPRADQ